VRKVAEKSREKAGKDTGVIGKIEVETKDRKSSYELR